MTKADAALNGSDNSRRQRAPFNYQRTGDDTPYRWDGVSTLKDGSPKLMRAGRSSNAGYAVKGDGQALTRYKEVGDFLAVTLMQDEAARLIGPYPELWDLTDAATKAKINTLLVTGRERAGVWIKANRGSLIHEVSDRVAKALIAGKSWETPVDDLYPEAERLGMVAEVVDMARELYGEFYTSIAAPVGSEMTAVHAEFNLAGTADHLLRALVDLEFPAVTLPAGTLFGGDTKGGRVDHYTAISQAAQLAAYFGKGAQRYVFDDEHDETGHPEEWPDDLNRETAVILNVPLDEALRTGNLELRLIAVDLIDGCNALELAREVAKFSLPNALSPAAAPVGVRHLMDSALVADLRASIDLVTHERTQEWLHQRLATISGYPAALARLRELWPDDVSASAIKDRTLDPEHVNGISRLLAHIESDFALPFPADDPRVRRNGNRSPVASAAGSPA